MWWWLLACQWQRLSQEEPLVQRTAEVGDQLGSAVLTGRLVRDCMRLALLIGRRYAPYSKWLGTAFAGLPDPDGLGSSLAEAMTADTLMVREEALGRAYQLLGERFNALSPDLRLDTSLRPYLFGRPVGLLWGENPFKCGHPGKHLDHRKSRPREEPFHPMDRPLYANSLCLVVSDNSNALLTIRLWVFACNCSGHSQVHGN